MRRFRGKSRRSKPLFIRLTVWEKSEVKKRAAAVHLTMDEFSRCKILDIPFEHISGTPDDNKSCQEQNAAPNQTKIETQSEQLQTSKATP